MQVNHKSRSKAREHAAKSNNSGKFVAKVQDRGEQVTGGRWAVKIVRKG